jgi:hypothetical protein
MPEARRASANVATTVSASKTRSTATEAKLLLIFTGARRDAAYARRTSPARKGRRLLAA